MEIGLTGGEEDGVDNTGADNNSLYTQPNEVFDVYKALAPISPNFSIAAAFGNVHGVYKPGNVVLRPDLLGKHQAYAAEQLKGSDGDKPMYVDSPSSLLYLLLLCFPPSPIRYPNRQCLDLFSVRYDGDPVSEDLKAPR